MFPNDSGTIRPRETVADPSLRVLSEEVDFNLQAGQDIKAS